MPKIKDLVEKVDIAENDLFILNDGDKTYKIPFNKFNITTITNDEIDACFEDEEEMVKE